MTITMLVYSLVFATLVGVAAAALDAHLRLGRRPARGIWAAALCIVIAATALAPLRIASTPNPAASTSGAVHGNVAPSSRSFADRIAQPFLAARRAAAGIADRALAHVPGLHSAALDRWLGATWFGATVILLLVLAAFHAHFRRARRAWPLASVDGVDVRLAPRTGPAVMGLIDPEIVVPTWLVSRDAAERQLVLDHEREHLRARDPLLLAGAYAVAALVPWHPVVWWMIARLRLAVEVDCDARVLGHGVAPRRYGALLIDLSARHPAAMTGVPALGLTLTNLERRLIAMTPHHRPFTTGRRCALAATAVAAFAIACDTPVPTSANDPHTVAAARTVPAVLSYRPGGAGDTATYRLDGVRLDKVKAESLYVTGDIRQISTSFHIRQDTPQRVNLLAKVTDENAARGSVVSPLRLWVTEDHAMHNEPFVAHGAAKTPAPPVADVVLIDGRPSTHALLQKVPAERIQSVSIFKGAKAAAVSSDPRASNGVISVTTKP